VLTGTADDELFGHCFPCCPDRTGRSLLCRAPLFVEHMFAHWWSPDGRETTLATISRPTDRIGLPPERAALHAELHNGSMNEPAGSVERLHQSEQHLLRTVDSLGADAWTEPSLLPGWSRAHVAAHLALNAEGLAGAIDGLAHELDVPVYESGERRDADIEELAQAEPSEIRERLFAGSQRLREALETLDESQWSRSVARVPGGPTWAVAEVPRTRRREVEIHHADLGAGYQHTAWPDDFAVELLDLVTEDHRGSENSAGFTVRATDTVRTWDAGAEQPVVVGTAADLGWWLVGRGDGDGLTCDGGDLPRLGPWRPTQAPTQAT
jgi:maleylpyruvate isomerase